MKRFLLQRLSAACALLLAAQPFLAAPTGAPIDTSVADTTAYRLVWHDEFDHDGPLNPADWDYERGFVRNNEPQWYQPENAVCRNGNLVITARREMVENPDYDATSKDWHRNREFAEYTSSSVITKGKHELRFGRFEVRARIPVSSGAWPAIWCLGNKSVTGEWPACGEIDILEFYDRHIWANACWSAGRWQSKWNSCKTPYTHFTERDAAWADKFHVWRMDWDADSIVLSLDGEVLNTIDLNKTTQKLDESCHVENPFHAPLYLILNLALRTPDGIDESKFPLTYYIDYVRLYEPAR